jgi:DNA-binding PadR family transcriptional regulator
MSVWRVLVKNLHDLGRPAPLRDWDDFSFTAGTVGSAIDDLRRHGLIQSLGLYGRHVVYALTPLGRDFCEGRVTTVRGLQGDPLWRKYRNTNSAYRHRAKQFQRVGLKTRFIATWLNPWRPA